MLHLPFLYTTICLPPCVLISTSFDINIRGGYTNDELTHKVAHEKWYKRMLRVTSLTKIFMILDISKKTFSDEKFMHGLYSFIRVKSISRFNNRHSEIARIGVAKVFLQTSNA